MGSYNPIPLGFQQPQPISPITSIGQLMQLRDAQAQVKLRQAQIQQAQQQTADTAAQAAQRQKLLADQNFIQQASQDPAAAARMHTGDLSDLEGHISPDSLDKFRQAQLAYQAQLNTNTKEQNANRATAQGEIIASLNGLKSIPPNPDGSANLVEINKALPGVMAHLSQIGALKDAGITTTPPQSLTDPKQIDDWLRSIGAEKAALDQTVAQQTAAAQLHEAVGKGAEANVNAAIKQKELDALNEGTGTATDKVKSILGPNADPARVASYAASYAAAPTLQDKAAVLAKAQSELSEVAVNKAEMPVREAEAANSAALQLGNEKTMKASGDFVESAKTLAGVHTTVATVNTLVDQAEAGIKSGATLAEKAIGARAAQQLGNTLPYLVKSIDDIKSRPGGAQSLNTGGIGEKVVGWAHKLSSGINASQDELEGIRGITGTILQAADQQHEANRQTLQAAYGKKLPSLTSSTGTVKLKSPSGQIKEVPADQVQHYKSLGAVEVQ